MIGIRVWGVISDVTVSVRTLSQNDDRHPVLSILNKHLKKAAEQRNANAMLTFGLNSANTNGGPKNFEEARAWLKKSAAAGNQSARASLSQLAAVA
jgi:hypothetical protein